VIDRQTQPRVDESLLRVHQQAGPCVLDRIPQTRDVERDRRRTHGCGLDHAHPPALVDRRLQEAPGASKDLPLLLIRNAARERHSRCTDAFQAFALGTVAHDHELPARQSPYGGPQLQQQVDALVGNKAAKRDKQRLVGYFDVWRDDRSVDAEVHDADPAGIHTDVGKRAARRP
jgi:hypothetical protein